MSSNNPKMSKKSADRQNPKGPKPDQARLSSGSSTQKPMKRVPRKGDKTGQKPLGEPISEAMRLNRFLAVAGVASRRKADEIIAEGFVTVNGELVREMGTLVQPGDIVVMNGKTLTPQHYRYILLNKPENTITTVEDDRGRKTVLDLVALPENNEIRIYPVGRLDRDTVGALLLTNDGELANRLMHPRYQIEKYYLVEADKSVKPSTLETFKEGIMLEEGLAKMDDADYVALPDRTKIGVKLHEGKNRQIRRMFEAAGHEVKYLERVRYAGLTTEGLRRGKWRNLTPSEVRQIRRSVKLR
ncbi:MAG: rRNA pseudouridine synthase [Rhodothermia bacterium]|nr:rRNA pseudouridine synthase [Rhodothermia bacterium]